MFRGLIAYSIFLLLAIGCSGGTSTAKYNKLVEEYNELVGKVNAQKKRNAKGDEDLRAASSKLDDMDIAVATFEKLIASGYSHLSKENCDDAKKLIEGELGKALGEINSRTNELTQNILVPSLTRISEDTSPYGKDFVESHRIFVGFAKTQLLPGLSGIKKLALQSRNRLANEYNRVCVEAKTFKEQPTEVAPPTLGGVYVDPIARPDNKVVTVDNAGKKASFTPEEFKKSYGGRYSEEAFSDFASFAKDSGGTLGFSPTPELFSKTVDVIFDSILERSGTQTDVVIVLDTTSSMSDDIENVKTNMGKLVEKLQTRAASIGLRLGLVLFRDKDDSYVSKIAMELTPDLTKVNAAIQGVAVGGGGDEPEAVIDALETALKSVSWAEKSKRSVILIGDAPGHERSHTGLSRDEVMSDYRKAGLGIVVYPIVVSK